MQHTWTDEEIVVLLLEKKKGLGRGQIAEALTSYFHRHFTADSVRHKLDDLSKESDGPIVPVSSCNDLYCLLSKVKVPFTIRELSSQLRVEPAQIKDWIVDLQGEGYNIRKSGNSVELTTELPIGTKLTIDPQTLYNGEFYRFGIISDTHLGSKYAREDVLKLAYDVFEREGITTVYHSGNIIDGYSKKINHFDLFPGLTGFTAQIDYLLKNYPNKKGITTNFITSACHEGWWISDIGINIGELIQLKAQNIGREDLKWIGHQEVDIELKQPKGSAVIRITHPGGGGSYATSYATQKLIESLSGGEKPAILICGHFHKALLHYVRNVWVIQSASIQDQTPWLRRHRISSEIGFWIIEFHQAKTGEINRFRGEFFPSFDKGYYKKYVSW